MTRKELQARVAAMQEGLWKHDIVNPYGDDGDRRACSRCGKMLHFFLWDGENSRWVDYRDTPCPIPDLVTIADSRECMGMAMEMFQALPNGKAMESLLGNFGEIANVKMPANITNAEWKMTIFWWFSRHATPAQIFEIVVMAAEAK